MCACVCATAADAYLGERILRPRRGILFFFVVVVSRPGTLLCCFVFTEESARYACVRACDLELYLEFSLRYLKDSGVSCSWL